MSLPVKRWIDQLRDMACSPITIVVLCGGLVYAAYTRTRRQHVTYDDEDYKAAGHTKLPVPLKGLRLTRKQLAEYNSNRADKTYLLALGPDIYDVSSAAHEFGPGCKYGMLPGTEITRYIKKQSKLNGHENNSCKDWSKMLEDIFYHAGKLVDDDNEDLKDKTWNPNLPELPEETEEDLDPQECLESASQGALDQDEESEDDGEEDSNRDEIDFATDKDATLKATGKSGT